MLEPGACEYARVSITGVPDANRLTAWLISKTIGDFLPELRERRGRRSSIGQAA